MQKTSSGCQCCCWILKCYMITQMRKTNERQNRVYGISKYNSSQPLTVWKCLKISRYLISCYSIYALTTFNWKSVLYYFFTRNIVWTKKKMMLLHDDCILLNIVCLKPHESQQYKQWTEVDSECFPGDPSPLLLGKCGLLFRESLKHGWSGPSVRQSEGPLVNISRSATKNIFLPTV